MTVDSCLVAPCALNCLRCHNGLLSKDSVATTTTQHSDPSLQLQSDIQALKSRGLQPYLWTEKPNTSMSDEVTSRHQCIRVLEGSLRLVLQTSNDMTAEEEVYELSENDHFDIPPYTQFALVTGERGAKYLLVEL